MATYTEAQWNKLNASLPVEDRTTYAEYLVTVRGGADSKTGMTAAAAATPTATVTPSAMTSLGALDILAGGGPSTVLGAGSDKAGGTVNTTVAPVTSTGIKPTGTTTPLRDSTTVATPTITPTTTPTTTVNTTLTPEEITNLNTEQIDAGIVTSTAATSTVTTTFPPAGTFLGWDYQNNTKTSGTLRRKIIADGKGGQKIDFGSAEKNPDYVLGSRSFGPSTTQTLGADDYTTDASGVLNFKGAPFTGSYNGKNYVNGKVTTPNDGNDYTTVAGVLNFKGTPFTGMYNGQEYVNGVIKQGVVNSGDFTTVNGVLMYKGAPYTGDYQGKKYINGQENKNASTVGGNYGGSGTTLDPFTENGKPFTGTMFGSTYKNGVIVDTAAMTAEDVAKQARLAANVEYANTMKGLGLPQDLIDELDNLIKKDFTKSQMYLELIRSDAYKNRFPGMIALRAAGKAVDEGTYINMERGFLQTLQYYGIDKNIFGTTAEMGKYIGGLTSPKEFEDRVSIAAQDVEKNPDVLAELNLYYGIDKSAAITYLLNPTVGLDLIKRQARAAEIGAQASKSKFDFGQTAAGYGVAESFINAAGTMDLATLDVTFQQSRQLASNQGKLAAIEGQKYDDLNAVTAILGKDQAAILESQRRAAREAARFGGGSGLGAGSLKSESAI